MNDFKMKLIHLHHCRGITWKTIFQILKTDPELKEIYRSPNKELQQFNYLSPLSRSAALHDLQSNTIFEQIRQYSSNNIRTITLFDQEYPSVLKETFQPPWVLYARGDVSLLTQEPKLAVVGAREATEYGKKAIDYLFPELINKGIVIVSGLAQGIDGLAHTAAMKLGGRTIGVIAGGFYHLYPREHKSLALTMMKQQLVISEHPPDTLPTRWQFPLRNRIISGLCRGTLIIEAKGKSGSLITANYAVNEGREVFAIPGNILSPNSAGTNELIQHGAKLVRNSKDILEEFYY